MTFHDTPLPQTFQQDAEQWRLATNRLATESKLTPLGELVREYLAATTITNGREPEPTTTAAPLPSGN